MHRKRNSPNCPRKAIIGVIFFRIHTANAVEPGREAAEGATGENGLTGRLKGSIKDTVEVIRKELDDNPYLPLYSPEQTRRHEVRPGISGWAQCHGRNTISWTEKFKLDVWYVDHCTLWTDIKVIWITAMKVLKRADINNDVAATMYPFDGTN